MKTLIAVILVVLVAIAAYFGFRRAKPKQEANPVVEQEAETAPAQIEKPQIVERKAPAATNVISKTTRKRDMPVTAAKSTGEWKAKLHAILGSAGTAEQKIQDLREMFGRLEEAEAEEAVQELTTMVKDEGYGFLKPLAVDPTLPEPVRDEFMVDMMNRPNSIKIPLFLEIARNPEHPDNESAYDSLEVFTGLKYGADWNAWEKGIETWLRENPDRVKQPQAPAQVN